MASVSSLTAGAARCDLTPAPGVALEGYGPRVALGVLDPLEALVLVLDDGTQRVVIVGVDHVSLLVSETDVVRAAVAAACGVPPAHVMVCFSHTHAGPLADAPYVERVARETARAAAEAARRLEPATLGWRTARADAAVNRRVIAADGNAVMGEAREGALDSRLGALRIEAADGRPIAGLVRFAAHANVLRGDNVQLSADWPGALRRRVEAALGCPVLVVNGSAGDVNPRWRGSIVEVDRMAEALTGPALECLERPLRDRLDALDDRSSQRLAVARAVFSLRLEDLPTETETRRRADEAVRAWDVDPAGWLAAVASRRARHQRVLALPVEVQVVRLGTGVLAGVPLETFTALGLRFAARAAGAPAFLNGYTNGWVGYLPASADLPHGGYEVAWAPIAHGAATGWLTPTRGGAAEELVEFAADRVRELFTPIG